MSDGSYMIVSQFGRHEVLFDFGDGEQRWEAAFADRLEAEDYRRKKSQPQPTGPTVRCRIAVGIDLGGEWVAHGARGHSDRDMTSRIEAKWGKHEEFVFIEADVPLPQRVEPVVIQGTVVEGESDVAG